MVVLDMIAARARGEDWEQDLGVGSPAHISQRLTDLLLAAIDVAVLTVDEVATWSRSSTGDVVAALRANLYPMPVHPAPQGDEDW
jgi:hypothetical protein